MNRTRRSLLAAIVLLPLAPLLAAAPALAAPRTTQAKSTNAYFQGVACAGASSCEAVGGWAYESAPSISRTLAEHWNGSRWSFQKTPSPSGAGYASLTGVACPGRSNCYAVGSNLRGTSQQPIAMHWNGSKWSADKVSLPAGALGGYLAAIACPRTTECVAVGSYRNSSRKTKSLAEHWSGSTLSPQEPVPSAKFSVLNGVSCTGKSNCIAVGQEETSSSHYVNLAEHWNGAKWSTQAVGTPTGSDLTDFYAVACHATTSCVAAGYEATHSNAVDKTLAQHWNGSKWKLSLPANPSKAAESFNQLNGVACPGRANCTAVGVYNLSSGAEVTLAEHWNGSRWKVVKTARPSTAVGSILAAVTCPSASSCVAVGQSWSGTKRLVYAALAEHWNGTKWTLTKTPAP